MDPGLRRGDIEVVGTIPFTRITPGNAAAGRTGTSNVALAHVRQPP